jgi:hypothetical protein
VPPKQRFWLHEEPPSSLLRKQPGEAREERSITWLKERPCYLATEHRNLVSKHDDLDSELVALGSA